jgi:hypothetical protein
MAEKPNNKKKLNLMLIQESLWQIEDKMNVILESIADHEAELIRMKRLTTLILNRIGKLEARSEIEPKGR